MFCHAMTCTNKGKFNQVIALTLTTFIWTTYNYGTKAMNSVKLVYPNTTMTPRNMNEKLQFQILATTPNSTQLFDIVRFVYGIFSP